MLCIIKRTNDDCVGRYFEDRSMLVISVALGFTDNTNTGQLRTNKEKNRLTLQLSIRGVFGKGTLCLEYFLTLMSLQICPSRPGLREKLQLHSRMKEHLLLELHKTCHSRAPAKEHCAQRRMSANENPHGRGKIAPGTSSLSPEASWPTTVGGRRPFKNNTVLCDERGRFLGEV